MSAFAPVAKPTSAQPASARPAPITGKSTPLLWWAFIGALFVALQLHVLVSWVTSPYFTPTPPGDDPLPTHTEVMIWVIQLGAPALLLLLFGRLSYLTYRHGRVPSYGLIVFGWLQAIWQDPLVNYVRPGFSYNSHFINFGSWCELVPGWLSPHGSRMPEPILFDGGAYLLVIPATVGICALAMRTAKRLYPAAGAVMLILVAFVTLGICDLVAEGLMVRTQMYAYMGSIYDASLWGGNWYQFPLYESFLGGAVITAVGSLYYFRNDKGQMLVERGLEQLQMKRGKELLRVLAVGGFVNVIVMTYTMMFVLVNLQLDPWPQGVPSYLRNGVCGEGTRYECPGDDVHIPLKRSGPLPPYTGRN